MAVFLPSQLGYLYLHEDSSLPTSHTRPSLSCGLFDNVSQLDEADKVNVGVLMPV